MRCRRTSYRIWELTIRSINAVRRYDRNLTVSSKSFIARPLIALINNFMMGIDVQNTLPVTWKWIIFFDIRAISTKVKVENPLRYVRCMSIKLPPSRCIISRFFYTYVSALCELYTLQIYNNMMNRRNWKILIGHKITHEIRDIQFYEKLGLF